jgi:RNA polymerase sigma factor (sigma-70 family)
MPEDAHSRAPGVKPGQSGKYRSVDSDDILVAACLRGDTQAWSALIERYQGLILSIALRRGLSRSDAEDVFQNVCVKLYMHLADLRDVRKLAGWLAAVTARESALLFRKDEARIFSETELLSDDSAAGMSEPASPDDGPEQEILTIERREVVSRMLSELSEECRKLLTMLYAADSPKSYNEIADDLNMPVGSIGPKRARCLAKLRSLLQGIGY